MRRILKMLFLFFPCLAPAQQLDTFYALPSIEVTAWHQSEIEDINTQIWNTDVPGMALGLSLDQLLQQQSLAFIRSYGAGNLATISVRGATSAQTNMVWNGVPVNNSMLGLADLSNVPVDGFDQLTLDYGADAIIYGSSSIGGNIRLDNQVVFQDLQEYRAQLGFGSFGRRQLHFESSWSNQRFCFDTKIGNSYSKNDFLIEQVNQQQGNSTVRRNYLMHTMGWKPSDNALIKLAYWRQRANRQIPPTLRQSFSSAYQIDHSDRLVVEMNKRIGGWLVNAKAAYMNEQLDYFDPVILLSSPSNIQTRFIKGEAQRNWDRFKLHLGLETRYSDAAANGYQDGVVEQNYRAAFGKMSYAGSNWHSEISLRQGHFNQKWIPLIPAFDIQYGDLKKWILFAGISGQYRIPSLNELYWSPGGNPELLAEQGWSGEVGSKIRLFNNLSNNSTFQLTGFYRNIDNWLQWTVPEGSNLFQALNINEIISYGLESKWSTSFDSRKFKTKLDLSYTFVRSYSNEALRIPKRAAREQLHYLPRHQMVLGLSGSYRSWLFNYTHQYQSIMDGFNKEIDAFHLADFTLAYNMQIKGIHDFRFQFEMRNVWNKMYEVVEFRPMPPRNYRVSIIYSIKNNAI